MNIVYMGTPEISVGPLKALYEAGHKISLVITQPDKPNSKRGNKMIPSPVKQLATELGLEVYQPKRTSSEDAVEKIRSFDPDAIVVCAFGQLLKKNVLESAKYGCINIHASLLPSYRGAAPIARCIMNGETKTGVTIMMMDEGLDTGDMLLKGEVDIDENDNQEMVINKLSDIGSKLILEALKKIEDGSIVRQVQGETDTDYAQKVSKEELDINFNDTSKHVHDKIRAVNPFTPARARLNGKIVQILETRNASDVPSAGIGVITKNGKNGFYVGCADSSILVLKVKPEGKGEMRATDFMNGIKSTDTIRFE